MGEYADEYIDSMIGDWDNSRRYYGYHGYIGQSRPAKKTNQQVFAGHAREKLFKAGDRVIHTPSRAKGVVTAVRGEGVFWKPDSRIKPGDIWVDEKHLTFDF